MTYQFDQAVVCQNTKKNKYFKKVFLKLSELLKFSEIVPADFALVLSL